MKIGGPGDAPMSYLGLALVLHAILVAVVVRWVGVYGWDDGAITLAYSKTFAESGRIALTALSEQTEGYSSTGWLLVNAGLALMRPSFEHAILLAQVATGVFMGVTLAMVWLLARAFGMRRDTTMAVLAILAIFGPSLAEVANAMEMTMLAASGMALIYLLYVRASIAWFCVITAIFLATRFEAMIYYAAIVAPLLLQRRYRLFFTLAVVGLAVTGLLELARYAAFEDIVPNTIRAKAHPPYSETGFLALYAHVRGTLEAVASLFPLLFGSMTVLAISQQARSEWLRCLRAPATIPPVVAILCSPILAVVLFVTAVGKNWGYTGRMEFLALPCGLILAGLMFDRYVAEGLKLRRRTTRILLAGMCGAIILVSWHQSAPYQVGLIARAMKGDDVGASLGITPQGYRATAMAVERVRALAGKPSIVFLTPDVGGVGLCCSRIRVVDIGLLTNRALAAGGYAAFPAVFARENPDVVGVHLQWAKLPRVYENPRFLTRYRPALVANTRLYIRDDVVDAIAREHALTYCYAKSAACLVRATKQHRYVDHSSPEDDAAFLREGRFLIIG